MRNIRFTIEEVNDDSGEFIGIVPNIFKNVGWDTYLPNFSPAHDLLEHGKNERGEVWQELKALGAYIFTSNFGLNNEIRRKYHAEKHHTKYTGENLASDIDSTIRDTEGYQFTLPEVPKYKLNKTEGKLFRMVFDVINSIVTEGKEAEEEGEYSDYEQLVSFWTGEDIELAKSWIMYGFANAKRRYKGEHSEVWFLRERINKVFAQKEETLKQYVNTGEEFTLSYDLSGHFEIKNKYYLI